MWSIEARNAAIANNYFVGAINRVGTVSFHILYYANTHIVLQPNFALQYQIEIIVINSKETRVVTYTCRYTTVITSVYSIA